jgi:ribosomal-protein-alanine N-acetyltransferase
MRREDLAAVMDLENGCHPDPWTADMLRTSLETGHHCLVLELDGALCGHAVLQVAGGEAELLNLCIGPGFRGCGLGRLLLRHLVAQARQAGAESMFLEVRASNRRAIQLYTGQGFRQVGRRPRYYRTAEGREDALVMARHLDPETPPRAG